QVDDALGDPPTDHVVEVHPELAFRDLDPRVRDRKALLRGQAQRIRALLPVMDVLHGLAQAPAGLPLVDALDACAAAWSARRIAAVRSVTPHPWTVVNTHAHYDHCFGNAAFRPATVWGSRGCASTLLATAEDQRAAVVAELRSAGNGAAAELVRTTPVDPPDALVDDAAVLDVGGREVVLRFLGRGHTDHDLVVEVEAAGDATVVFAGDLVEQGAPPA